MVEHKIQSGYIKCMDKPYIFTYDGDLLQLVPKDEESIKPYDFLINKNMNFHNLLRRGACRFRPVQERSRTGLPVAS